jgi:hypothetical protein
VTFPEALAAVLSESKIVTRIAWHGEIFIYLEKACQAAVDAEHPLASVLPENTTLQYHGYVAIRTHGGVMPFTPVQHDMFADDWSIVTV